MQENFAYGLPSLALFDFVCARMEAFQNLECLRNWYLQLSRWFPESAWNHWESLVLRFSLRHSLQKTPKIQCEIICIFL